MSSDAEEKKSVKKSPKSKSLMNKTSNTLKKGISTAQDSVSSMMNKIGLKKKIVKKETKPKKKVVKKMMPKKKVVKKTMPKKMTPKKKVVEKTIKKA